MFFKYLLAILKLQQIADAYEADQGGEKPWYLTRRFWGVTISVLSGIALSLFGVEIQGIEQLPDHIVNMIGAGTGIYGVVMFIVGFIKRKQEATE